MSEEEREATIRAMLPAVRRIARRIRQVLRGVEIDDLVGDGCVGLIRAVDSYDPARGASLNHYARRLILGTMLNGVRRMDPVPERSRRALRQAERERYAIAARRGDLPSKNEMESLHPGYLRACAAVSRAVPLSLDALLPDGESAKIDWSEDPAALVSRSDERSALHAAIAGLTVRQRTVLVMHYYGEEPLRAIGERLSISSQRASQLHLCALERLRKSKFAAPR